MIIRKTTVAGKVVAVLMVVALLFAANCCAIDAAAASYGTTIYVKTTKTSTPYIYYWVDGGIEAGWPGKPMTAEGSDVYSFELPVDLGELTGIIVNGSSGGDKLTGDVKNISGNLYDVDAGQWSTYDTSAVKITSYGADNDNLYVGSKTTLSMNAKGSDENIQYKFSVNGLVLSDFSKKNTVLWNPTVAGEYTVVFEAKDGSGESNSKEITYTVQSVDGVEDPIFLSASPANGAQIKKDSSVTVTVNGAGGQVNNKVLFYKTEVVDPNGSVVNTAYYQTGSKITFTPSMNGEYTVNMYIQNNTVKNTTVTASYTYNSVNEITEEPDTQSDVIDSDTDSRVIVSDTDTQSDVIGSDTDDTDSEDTNTDDTNTDVNTDVNTDSDTESDTDTEVPDTAKGDIDNSGKTELKDAYEIQKGVLSKRSFTAEEIARADVNGDGRITLKDASLIQRYMAGLITL